MTVEITNDRIEAVATEVVDAAFKVHKSLGAGLLESAYGACMVHELVKRNLKVVRQVTVPITYDGILIDAGFRLDIMVEDLIIIELKAVDQLHPVHHQQLLTYLKLMNKPLGFLINFNVALIKNGIHRIIK